MVRYSPNEIGNGYPPEELLPAKLRKKSFDMDDERKYFTIARAKGGWVWSTVTIRMGKIIDLFTSEPDLLKIISDRMKIEYQKYQNNAAAAGWSDHK